MSKYNITMKQKNDSENTKEDIDNVDYDMDIL
jgi:hypothetical protein